MVLNRLYLSYGWTPCFAVAFGVTRDDATTTTVAGRSRAMASCCVPISLAFGFSVDFADVSRLARLLLTMMLRAQLPLPGEAACYRSAVESRRRRRSYCWSSACCCATY